MTPEPQAPSPGEDADLRAHLEANPHLDPCAPSPNVAEVVAIPDAELMHRAAAFTDDALGYHLLANALDGDAAGHDRDGRPGTAARARQGAKALRVLSLPQAGGGEDQGSLRAKMPSAPEAPMPTGRYRCTRCGRDEIDGRANGCERGPCPMEFVG